MSMDGGIGVGGPDGSHYLSNSIGASVVTYHSNGGLNVVGGGGGGIGDGGHSPFGGPGIMGVTVGRGGAPVESQDFTTPPPQVPRPPPQPTHPVQEHIRGPPPPPQNPEYYSFPEGAPSDVSEHDGFVFGGMGTDEGTRSVFTLSSAVTPPTASSYIDCAESAPHNSVVTEARKRWKDHGIYATQALEERRSGLMTNYPFPTPQQLVGLPLGGRPSAMPYQYSSNPQRYQLRVTTSQARVDPSGWQYTTYVIEMHIHQYSIDKHVVEHRYSEFAKLRDRLMHMLPNTIKTARTSSHLPDFPRKSWAGRVGHWTPSLALAPERHYDLVDYRREALDVWLVYMCHLVLGINTAPNMPGERWEDARKELQYFLVTSSTDCLPCDRENHVPWLGATSQDTLPSPSELDENEDLDDDYYTDARQQLHQNSHHPHQSPSSLAAIGNVGNRILSSVWRSDSGSNVTPASSSYKSSVLPPNPVTFTLGSSIRQASLAVMRMCCAASMSKGTSSSQVRAVDGVQAGQYQPSSGIGDVVASTVPVVGPNNPLSKVMDEFQHGEPTVPPEILKNARGLCFLTVAKAGLVFSGRIGTGLVVARRRPGHARHVADGASDNLHMAEWSAPTAVGTIGMGWGALAGGDVTTYLIVLNTESALTAFASGTGNVNLGAELDVAVGPLGRAATGNIHASPPSGLITSTRNSRNDSAFANATAPTPSTPAALAPAYAYAHSRGFFVGVSLEGGIIGPRPDVNAKFYGKPVEAGELLLGAHSAPPRAAQPLYEALDRAMNKGRALEARRPVTY